MKEALANYVLALNDAARGTHEANDRPVYRALLAEAAVLLATAVVAASRDELIPLLKDHERTRGHTWIRGAEHRAVDAAWETVVKDAPGLRVT